VRHRVTLIALAIVSLAAPLRAQNNVVDLTKELLDRFLRGAQAEKAAEDKVSDQLAEIDAKLKAFHDCATAFKAAGEASGSKLGGFAAKMAMKAKCGATSDEDMLKDRQKIVQGPMSDAAKQAGMKLAEYSSLKDRITGFLHGDHSGFTQAGLDLLGARQSELSGILGVAVMQAGAAGGVSSGSMGNGRMARMPTVWSTDYAWSYIGELFAMEYASGASLFETAYKPGEWTRWDISQSDDPDSKQTLERAFLGTTPDSGEWWRMKTTVSHKEDDKVVVDTVVLESLFKPMGENMKHLVRMRGKLPGSKDAQELMVPTGMSMIPMSALFPMKPTPESIQGATVGTDNISTGDGSVSAKHVRFGAGGGSIDWWLTDAVPGGWAKFTGGNGQETYTMQMTGQGTGAKSELGVIP
jgi:hypothetical protein